MPVCRTLEINPLAGARLGRNRHRRQILKPALGLYEPAHFGRHGPRIEVVDDKDHDRQAAFEFVQLGQEAEPLLVVELAKDLLDQRLGFGALEMPPVRALGCPIGFTDELDDRAFLGS